MIIPSPPEILHLVFSYQIQSLCVQMLFWAIQNERRGTNPELAGIMLGCPLNMELSDRPALMARQMIHAEGVFK